MSLDLLHSAWFWRGLLSGSLVALSCVPLGVLLYFRRMSLLTDALAHVSLPGIVLAFLLTGSLDGRALLPGAAAMGLVAALLIERLSRVRHVRPDAAIGVVFTVLFAGGVIALSTLVRDVHLDVNCLLFGDILGVSDQTLVNLALTTLGTQILTLAGRRWLEASTFDETFARTVGVPVSWIRYLLIAAAAMAAAAAFEAVGAILVIAFFTLPAAFAHQITRTMGGLMVTAQLFALMSVAAGMAGSILWNTSTGGTIVVVQAVVYGVTVAVKNRPSRRSPEPSTNLT